MTADPHPMLALSQTAFRSAVDQDVRGKLPRDLAGQLRDGNLEVTERWYQTLVFMKKNVESTLAARREETKSERMEYISHAEALEQGIPVRMDKDEGLVYVTGAHGRIEKREPTADDIAEARDCRAKADTAHRAYLKWRTGALRFRAGVEEALSEATWRRATTEKSLLLERNRQLIDRVDELRARVNTLVAGITIHRDAMAELDEDDIDDTDRNLWALVTTDTASAAD